VFVQRVSETQFLTAVGPQIKVWESKDGRWHLVAQDLRFQGLNVLQVVPLVKLRYGVKAKCFLVLYENGNLCFWNSSSLMCQHSLKLPQETEKVVVDKSSRFFAGLDKSAGQVRVYSVKSGEEIWALNFASVSNIEADSECENQFVIAINSLDDPSKEADSLLLFQFSQKSMVKYWKT